MSYRKFSTENADYYLVYAAHKEVTDEDILRQPEIESLDAIVLESGELGYNETEIFIDTQYSEIIKNIKQSQKKPLIYLVDVNVTEEGELGGSIRDVAYLTLGVGLSLGAIRDFKKKSNRRQFLKGGLKTLAALSTFSIHFGQIINSHIKGKAIPVFPELNSAAGYFLPTSLHELRNAITARKIEEFIVPKLQKELGKKPLIAIVYGGFHAGIETDLKYVQLRDVVLSIYKKIDYAGIKKHNLNAVFEIDLKNGIYGRHDLNNMF
ncbi:hypothetical protein GOV03_00645 [Candidatus Woesearchaeota archaeon]|nr:hypothetical protein [Candidatus Woesearchaeota archaeon]